MRPKVAAPEEARSVRRQRIGALIRSARRDTSQAALGRLLGDVPQTTISRWEKGTVDLTLEQLIDLETALQLEPLTLIFGCGYGRRSEGDLYDVIMADDAIDPDLRQDLAASYRKYVAYTKKRPAVSQR